jgi:uncharacterized protein YdcH (DUF465 family)
MQKYHELDYTIRELEVSGSPIDDDNMHNLKVERMELKDTLYKQLSRHHQLAEESK